MAEKTMESARKKRRSMWHVVPQEATGKHRIIDDEELLVSKFDAKIFARFVRYIFPYKDKLMLAFGLMCVCSLASLSGPYIFRIAIDRAIKPSKLEYLPWLAAGYLLANILLMICLRYRVRVMEKAGRTAIAKLRQDLFDHIQNLGFTYFDNRPAGKIMTRVINDVNALMGMFTDGIVNLLIDCFTLIILVILMLTISAPLTAVALSVTPLLILFVFKVKGKMRSRWQRVRIKTSSLNAYLHESLAGMRLTQAFSRENVNSQIFYGINTECRDRWLYAVKINNLFFPTLDVISTLGTVLVYLLSMRLMDTRGLEVGAMIAILWYLARFWEPLNSISNFFGNIQTAMASMERIFEILDTPIDVRTMENASVLPSIVGHVAFEHVTFGYDETKVVLEDVSFDIPAGETVALVGPTGAGKSTIINLISRFYDTQQGSVRIDGYDVKEVDLHSLRSQMGIMLQDTFIFSGTIMDNIRYGRLNATDAEVMEAAKAVSAHDFIMDMEKGYDTEVNERGTRLSVGQKQLIAFARALLADPRILILDEATSSIDTETEILIQKALARLLKGRTSFVIAHRLSTIRQADRIMVVDRQGIMESGSHDELMVSRGHYYELVKAQYRFLGSGAKSA